MNIEGQMIPLPPPIVKISSTLSGIYQKIIFFSTERIVTQVNETTNDHCL